MFSGEALGRGVDDMLMGIVITRARRIQGVVLDSDGAIFGGHQVMSGGDVVSPPPAAPPARPVPSEEPRW